MLFQVHYRLRLCLVFSGHSTFIEGIKGKKMTKLLCEESEFTVAIDSRIFLKEFRFSNGRV